MLTLKYVITWVSGCFCCKRVVNRSFLILFYRIILYVYRRQYNPTPTQLNGKMPIIKTGSKVIQLENAARASLFTFSELQSLLGVSDFDSEKCSIVVTNGDYGTNQASINSADINTSTQRVGINFSGASLGGCRVNYSVIYSP